MFYGTMEGWFKAWMRAREAALEVQDGSGIIGSRWRTAVRTEKSTWRYCRAWADGREPSWPADSIRATRPPRWDSWTRCATCRPRHRREGRSMCSRFADRAARAPLEVLAVAALLPHARERRPFHDSPRPRRSGGDVGNGEVRRDGAGRVVDVDEGRTGRMRTRSTREAVVRGVQLRRVPLAWRRRHGTTAHGFGVDLRIRAGEHLRDDREWAAERDAGVRAQNHSAADVGARGVRAIDEWTGRKGRANESQRRDGDASGRVADDDGEAGAGHAAANRETSCGRGHP